MKNTQLSIIVAVDRNMLIGKNGTLPWHIPEDLRYFKQKTMGHPILMGKNTWLGLQGPLPGRLNLVLTRDKDFQAQGATVCHSVEDCLCHCDEGECFITGGAQVFRLFLPLISKIYLTRIEAEFEGDAYFPEFNLEEWELIKSKELLSKTGYKLTFNEYIRKAPALPTLDS
ncbi:MAG: dihydrofolate reductase [Candidatus Cloacimonadaceae bacterium]|jgi:dihydrofolate reductase|nr:dihydrofolate reductase [Candidatus Cloacimonadota bacterium]MDX9949811.1 dihydrofolate reductase [Candidatus Syntrophosphaera sp.]NLN84994.1 dihydrofolate reductase [Candidatus Cloacimonadota bacterium]